MHISSQVDLNNKYVITQTSKQAQFMHIAYYN